MEKALARFIRHHKTAGHSPKTVTYYQENIGQFITWSKSKSYSTVLDDLEVDAVRQWLDEQRERGLSQATLAARAQAMKAFTSWLTEEEYVDRNPLRKL